MSEVIRVRNSEDNTDSVHIVIGHAQILDCWDFKFDSEDLNFPLDWICKRDGTSSDFLEIMEQEMKEASLPLKITALIWLNNIPTISVDTVKRLIQNAENLLCSYPQHSLVFPEMMFAPKFKAFSEKVTKINLLLNDFNIRRGYVR